MAYARFSEKKSNVYVWGDLFGNLHCTACRINPEGSWFGDFTTTDKRAMLEHLQEHRQRRSFVPWHATRRLKREIRRGW